MKTKAGPAIVGAFVIGAFVLIVVALLAFGGVSFFSKPERFMVMFDESIHGLDLGSPVKLRGVRVGRVVDTTSLHRGVLETVGSTRRQLTSPEAALRSNRGTPVGPARGNADNSFGSRSRLPAIGTARADSMMARSHRLH